MKYILLLLFKIAFSSFTSNEKTVWNYLIKQGFTQAGAAGLMGNLKADSSVRSILYEESYKKKLGWSNQEYVDKVNNGEYSENDFVNDKIGFGLAQWTYPTRKKALYDNCKGKMGNLKCQLEYLVDELKNDYSEVNELLKSSNNIRECTIKVLTDFENPKGRILMSKILELNFLINFIMDSLKIQKYLQLQLPLFLHFLKLAQLKFKVLKKPYQMNKFQLQAQKRLLHTNRIKIMNLKQLLLLKHMLSKKVIVYMK